MNKLYAMGTKEQKNIYTHARAKREDMLSENTLLSVPKGMLYFPDLFKLFRVQGDFTFK